MVSGPPTALSSYVWHHRCVPTPDLQRLARTAYEAHRDAHPGPLPPWEATTAQEQQAWKAAVAAVTAPSDPTLAEGAPVKSIIIQAGDQTKIFHNDFTVGRQGSLVINDDRASGQHAHFMSAHGFWYVEDLGSTNGTWLNGRRIFQGQRLKKGDKVKIGRTVLVIVGG
jgi:pSer/pThr/pTyr-binding forkhead associated (FHA) protein